MTSNGLCVSGPAASEMHHVTNGAGTVAAAVTSSPPASQQFHAPVVLSSSVESWSTTQDEAVVQVEPRKLPKGHGDTQNGTQKAAPEPPEVNDLFWGLFHSAELLMSE